MDHSLLRLFASSRTKGKTGTVHRNVNYLFATVAILHLWMITGTINAKLSRGAFCEIDTFLPNRIRLEAVLVFFFLSFILFAMKMTTAYVLNEFNDTGGLKSSISEGRSSSLLQHTLNWFIQNAFSSMSNTFDTLFDREDERNELTSSSSANVNRTDNALQRSIEKSRKNIKVDLKSMLEQLQLSLREMEEQTKIDISNAITSAIAQSQQHIIEAMNQNQEDNILREEESESDHNSSDSSLSIGDVANLSQHM